MAGAGDPVQPVAPGRVGELVVILEVEDESRSVDPERRRPPALPLPGIPLALPEVSPSAGRDELPGGALIVGVIALATAGGGDHRGVVEVVDPGRVEAESALGDGPEQSRVLRLVLADDDLAGLDAAFPPPRGKRPLEML